MSSCTRATSRVSIATPVAVLSLYLGLLACGGDEVTGAGSPESPREAASQAGATAVTPSPPRRAVWVLAEGSQRVLESAARIDTLIADAERLGVTDLFVQVYRGGRAWYDSRLADATPYRQLLKTTGGDGLKMLLAAAHARGIRVHAWVNVLSLSHNKNAPIIQELGPGAVLVDRRGRSLLDYPNYEVPQPDRAYYRMGTPGIALDPGAPGVRDHIVATYAELVERYPELDGLHLDYIRHPGVLPLIPGSRFGVGLDFGYGEESRANFQRATGLAAPREGNMVNLSRWDEWRRDQVTQLVAAIRGRARQQKADLELSAAVIAYADRAYQTLAQDWVRWLEEDLIDFAVPMIYTLDDRLLRYQAERFAGRHAERTWAGLGTWLFATRPERAVEQLAIARAAGLRHHSLFSYDSMVEARDTGLLDGFATPATASIPGSEASTLTDGD